MSETLSAEERSYRVETIGGWPIAVTTYRLGSTYYCKAQIHLPGAGARIAQAQEPSRQAAEEKVLAQVRAVVKPKS